MLRLLPSEITESSPPRDSRHWLATSNLHLNYCRWDSRLVGPSRRFPSRSVQGKTLELPEIRRLFAFSLPDGAFSVMKQGLLTICQGQKSDKKGQLLPVDLARLNQGKKPESFPKWLLRHRHVSRGGLPAARLLQSGEALRPPPNPLPQPSKRFARRESSPGSRGNHRADSPPVAKPARKLFQTKVRLQTASPHAPLPTPAPPRHPRSGRFSFALTHGLTLLPPLAMMDPIPPHTVAPLSHLPQPQLSTIP